MERDGDLGEAIDAITIVKGTVISGRWQCPQRNNGERCLQNILGNPVHRSLFVLVIDPLLSTPRYLPHPPASVTKSWTSLLVFHIWRRL